MTATLTPPLAGPAEPAVPSWHPSEPPRRARLTRIVRGAPGDPSWARPALLLLLAATGVLYLWDLSASGYANSFYSAAVQSGTQSWKAWFFGSLDSGNSITVDKPPGALWVMGLSARLFGFNSWSILAPQALEGVAAVGLLYGAVRRISGHVAGLAAGAVLALTPAAVLMFRFNNPDALLTLLLVLSAYALTRSLERARTSWLALSGSALGFAFLTKMLQGFLVVPAFALVYLVAAPTSLRRRIAQTGWWLLAIVASAGWWVAAVALWPASSRPYIGGSTNNSVLDLVLGYNGLGRLFGSSPGNAGGRTAANAGFGGASGLTRLFTSELGNEISWLMPAAVVGLAAGLWLTRAAPRTDRTRAALLLWGGWYVITSVVFSYMQGTMHPYYTVALAPAIGVLVAIGARLLWRVRGTAFGRGGLAAMTAAAGAWSAVLLGRAAWHPELRYAVLALTVLALSAVFVPLRRLGRAALVTGLIAGLLGTTSFALATAATPHTGSIPSVGTVANYTRGPGGATGGGPGRGATGSGSSALVAALKASTTTWAAATVGDQSAAELELASGKAVIAIGGWSGSDASPTLAQFQAYVAAGAIHYFIGGSNQGGPGGSSGTASQIAAWVAAHYTATTIGGQTVYDLTASATS